MFSYFCSCFPFIIKYLDLFCCHCCFLLRSGMFSAILIPKPLPWGSMPTLRCIGKTCPWNSGCWEWTPSLGSRRTPLAGANSWPSWAARTGRRRLSAPCSFTGSGPSEPRAEGHAMYREGKPGRIISIRRHRTKCPPPPPGS